MLDAYLMMLHLWLYQHFLLHVQMYEIYRGVKEKHRDKYASYREEMYHAGNSIWRTYLYVTARLNMRLTETLTPPTA